MIGTPVPTPAPLTIGSVVGSAETISSATSRLLLTATTLSKEAARRKPIGGTRGGDTSATYSKAISVPGLHAGSRIACVSPQAGFEELQLIHHRLLCLFIRLWKLIVSIVFRCALDVPVKPQVE